MKTRRLILKGLLVGAILPLAPRSLRRVNPLHARPLGSGLHELDGWILTNADMEMLRDHVS